MNERKTSALFSWALYDWANSAFVTVIITFVFSAYFTKAVAPNPIVGTELWGYAIGISALGVAVFAPLMGAIADMRARRKPWLFFFTYLCVVASAALWVVRPDAAYVAVALVLVGLANFAFEMGMVFYNAMLRTLVTPERVGRLSGLGWGLGYIGGLACLATVLVGFVQTENPWFGINTADGENLRAVCVWVAVWMGVFAVPIFFFTPETGAQPSAHGVPPRGLRQTVASGVAELVATLSNLRAYADQVRFLLARMLYTDGLNTLFAFGGIYAAGTFGFAFDELIMFGIAINVTAGLGAAGSGWLDDAIGPKRTIYIALFGLLVLGAALLVVESKTMFWLCGVGLGLFVGPAQSASRSLMTHLTPVGMESRMFGLYALSGKATAFLGPMVLAWVTGAMESQRAGMATILVFFVAGALVLRTVPDARR